MDILNMQAAKSVPLDSATNRVSDDANVRVEPKRLHHPPVMRPGESSSSRSRLNTLLPLAAWETLEDVEQQTFLQGPPPPEKPRTAEQYRLLINSVLTRLLADKANGKDVLTDAMEAILAGVAAFTQNVKAQFDALVNELNGALEDLEEAGNQVKNLESQLSKLEARIAILKEKQVAMQQAGVGADDPEYQALLSELTGLESQRANAHTALQAAKSNAEQLAVKATEIQSRINDLVATTLQDSKHSRLLNADFIEEQAKAQFNMALRLLNVINQSIKDRAEEAKQRAEHELKRAEFNTEMAGRARVEQAKKIEEQHEKNEQAKKKSDCISKIVSALLTVASVLLSVVTMGAGSVLAVALLVMTVADGIMQAATGTSFIGKALEPLMKSVIMPIIEAIGKAVDFLLMNSPLGKLLQQALPPDVLEQARSVVKTIVAVLAVIAAVMLLKSSAVAKVMNSVINGAMKFASNLFKSLFKNIPQFLKSMGKMSDKALQSLQSLSHKANQSVVKAANITHDVASAANITQQNIMSAKVAESNLEKIKAEQAVKELEFIREKQLELEEMMQESLERLQESIRNLSEMALRIIENNLLLGKKILLPVKAG